MTAGRDPVTGRLQAGHAVRPAHRGGPSEAELIRKKLAPHREAILDKVIDLALQGDPRSAELAMKYLAPPAKPDSERIAVPGLATAVTFAEKCTAVISAVSDGSISAEAGERVLRLLDVYRKAHETDALEARIAMLETQRTVTTAPTVPADVVDINNLV